MHKSVTGWPLSYTWLAPCLRQRPRPLGAALLGSRFILPGGIYPLDPLTSAEEESMPFKVEGDEKLDCVVNVRLSAREKARLLADAQNAGVTMSTLVRRRYFGRNVIAKTDVKMMAELRRVGGLLKAINLQTNFRGGPELSAALRAVRVCIERLSSDRQEDTVEEDQE